MVSFDDMVSFDNNESLAGTVDRLDLLEERTGAISRTGKRLKRFLSELQELEQELDRMEFTLQIPGLSHDIQQNIELEMDLSVDAYNHLREAASDAYQQLVYQRESCGFRGHEVLERCYPIPDLLLPGDMIDLMEQ